MSGEEFYIEDGDGFAEEYENGQTYEGAEEYAAGDETEQYGDAGLTDTTPEGLYRAAKDMIGFDDNNAVALFYGVYNDEAADLALRAKALRRAAVVLAAHDDMEQITQAVELVFACYGVGMISPYHLEQTIQRMLNNVVRSEAIMTEFLELASARVDCNTQIGLYLDLKLRQCDLMMKYADYERAKMFMSDVEQFCPIPPDPSDISMCRSALKLIILHIDFADLDHDEEKMFKDYELAMGIKSVSPTARQAAALTHVEGLKALRDGDMRTARSKFWDAFKTFNDTGSDKRIHCLPYVALATMLCRESVNVFMAPECMGFMHHPVVAPLAQLTEAYLSNNILLFNQRLESAQKVFHNDPFYAALLDNIRHHVLTGAVLEFCESYTRVDISFAAKELDSQEDEVKSIMYNLIHRNRLLGLIDPSSNVLAMKPPVKPSPYIENIEELLTGMEAMVEAMDKKIQIRV